MNYGLLEGIRDARDYIFGASKLPRIVYQPNGDWEFALPKYEAQADYFETNGCTVWGTQNQIETFYKGVYGIEPNYSERFTYLLTPIDPQYGSDPQKVYECIRKDGLVGNDLFPIVRSKDEFLDTTKITTSLRKKGQEWLGRHELKHEWLWNARPDNALEVMKEALLMSPLGVSVYAWHEKDGKYIDNGQRNNHWCMCYRIDDEGIHVFDSYDHSKKVLALDHKIARAKRIWLHRNTIPAMKKQVGVLQLILNVLMQKKTLTQVVEEHIGIDVTPVDAVSDEVACAEVTTTLLKKAGIKIPVISGTWTLWKYLTPANGWVLCAEPEPECIIISPTGSVPKSIGHVGIILENNVIASNDSRTGKLLKNYTVETWHERYAKKLGMPVYYYKHI